MARSCILQNNSSRHKQQEIRITQLIMAVVGLFLICNTCTIICYAYVSKNGFAYSGMGDTSHSIVNLIGVLFVLISTSLNSVIYGIFNKKYRKMFEKYFYLRKSEEKKTSNTDSKTSNLTNIKLTKISVGQNVSNTLE